jgi:hypothetical protein
VSRNKALFGAGLAVAAAVAWLGLRRCGGGAAGGGGTAGAGGARAGAAGGAAPASGAGAASGSGPVRTGGALRPPIHVPGVGDGAAAPGDAVPSGPHPSLAQAFAAEARAPAWADEHERMIRRRLATVGVPGVALDAVECRAHQCRITVTAPDDPALARYLDGLSKPSALYGIAESIVLEAIATTPDGRRRDRIYARFAE